MDVGDQIVAPCQELDDGGIARTGREGGDLGPDGDVKLSRNRDAGQVVGKVRGHGRARGALEDERYDLVGAAKAKQGGQEQSHGNGPTDYVQRRQGDSP